MRIEPRCQEYDTCEAVSSKYYAPAGEYRHCNDPCYYCHGYNPVPIVNVIEKKTVYVENVTDGKFLKLQAEVRNLQDKIGRVTIGKKQKSRYA